MQTIRINDVEIQFDDGLDLSIEDGGKRIVVRGKSEVVRYVPMPYPYPQPYVNPVPIWQSPTTWPIITCSGQTSSVGVPIGGALN